MKFAAFGIHIYLIGHTSHNEFRGFGLLGIFLCSYTSIHIFVFILHLQIWMAKCFENYLGEHVTFYCVVRCVGHLGGTLGWDIWAGHLGGTVGGGHWDQFEISIDFKC